MAYTQDHRFLKIETALGDDTLLLLSLAGAEELSHLFRFQLDLIAEDPNLSFDQIVGTNATISLEMSDGKTYRYFNGYISRFSLVVATEGAPRYQAEFVPWLWFLTRTSDCRIFQNQSVPEIIAQVFNDHGFKDFNDSGLTATYAKREYCVQYRETAFNFVSRLMEESGIFYFFAHENGKHTLVLGDLRSVNKTCPFQSEVFYQQTRGAGAAQSEDGVFSWQLEHALRSGRYELQDYNFKNPGGGMQVSTKGMVDEGGNQNWQLFDYPGGYLNNADGSDLVDIRMDEEEVRHALASGNGNVRSFAAGFTFTIDGLNPRDLNASYILTSVIHSASQDGSFAGFVGVASYQNSFTCVPNVSEIHFRPERVTPEPVVHGSQTAVVVGPSGEEIYTDKFGRVKVQFHWDRHGKSDESSSCWIRVSQVSAGKGWGTMWLPRVGQEVIVDFLEGDPDQPIITGRVYNADQVVPYTLPDEKTKSTIKTHSYKGGGGFNEFRFEDQKGREQVFLNAQKDLHFRAKDSRFENIDGSASYSVGKDQFEKVLGDKHLQIKGDQNEKIDGTVSLNAGQNLEHKVGMKYAADAGMEVHLKAGMNMILESGVALTLKVGGNFINLNPAGVFVSGTMVMINSGGAAGSGSGASPAAPKDPVDADTATPGKGSTPPPLLRPPKPSAFSPAAMVLKQAASTGAPFCAT